MYIMWDFQPYIDIAKAANPSIWVHVLLYEAQAGVSGGWDGDGDVERKEEKFTLIWFDCWMFDWNKRKESKGAALLSMSSSTWKQT